MLDVIPNPLFNRLKSLAGALACCCLLSPALAHHVDGHVLCVDTVPQIALQGVVVRVDTGESATTDANGYYWITLPTGVYRTYIVTVAVPDGLTPWDPVSGSSTFEITANSVSATRNFSLVGCHVPGPGTGTPGFWKNHPEAWPVEGLLIGGLNYTKSQAIGFMQLPTSKNKWLNMFEQQVAAKLNVLIGNDSSCIAATIAGADVWLAANPGAVAASSSAWRNSGSALHGLLDDYNNGRLCAPHRD